MNGHNTPIYDMSQFIYANDEIKADIIGTDDKWLSEYGFVEQYMRVFFDNVKGRHGRFEIIDAYGSAHERTGGYELLKDRIDKDAYETPSASEGNVVFHKDVAAYFKTADKIPKAIQFNKDSNYTIWEGAHMFFKGSIFKSDVVMTPVKDSRGNISLNINLKNEELLTHFDFLPESRQASLKSQEEDEYKDRETIFPLITGFSCNDSGFH